MKTKEEYKQEFEEKKILAQAKMEFKCEQFKRWFERNKLFIGLASGPAIALARECVITARKAAERKNEYERLCRVYDRSTGLHYNLKHPLTGEEAKILSAYQHSGLSTFDFLSEYDLLKR